MFSKKLFVSLVLLSQLAVAGLSTGQALASGPAIQHWPVTPVRCRVYDQDQFDAVIPVHYYLAANALCDRQALAEAPTLGGIGPGLKADAAPAAAPSYAARARYMMLKDRQTQMLDAISAPAR